MSRATAQDAAKPLAVVSLMVWIVTSLAMVPCWLWAPQDGYLTVQNQIAVQMQVECTVVSISAGYSCSDGDTSRTCYDASVTYTNQASGTIEGVDGTINGYDNCMNYGLSDTPDCQALFSDSARADPPAEVTCIYLASSDYAGDVVYLPGVLEAMSGQTVITGAVVMPIYALMGVVLIWVSAIIGASHKSRSCSDSCSWRRIFSNDISVRLFRFSWDGEHGSVNGWPTRLVALPPMAPLKPVPWMEELPRVFQTRVVHEQLVIGPSTHAPSMYDSSASKEARKSEERVAKAAAINCGSLEPLDAMDEKILWSAIPRVKSTCIRCVFGVIVFFAVVVMFGGAVTLIVLGSSITMIAGCLMLNMSLSYSILIRQLVRVVGSLGSPLFANEGGNHTIFVLTTKRFLQISVSITPGWMQAIARCLWVRRAEAGDYDFEHVGVRSMSYYDMRRIQKALRLDEGEGNEDFGYFIDKPGKGYVFPFGMLKAWTVSSKKIAADEADGKLPADLKSLRASASLVRSISLRGLQTADDEEACARVLRQQLEAIDVNEVEAGKAAAGAGVPLYGSADDVGERVDVKDGSAVAASDVSVSVRSDGASLPLLHASAVPPAYSSGGATIPVAGTVSSVGSGGGGGYPTL